MTFIIRFVIILFVFAFVVYVMKSITRLRFNLRRTAKEVNRLRDQPRSGGSMQMVRCAACGAFVAPEDAVKIVSSGQAQLFCSHDCLKTHARTA